MTRGGRSFSAIFGPGANNALRAEDASLPDLVEAVRALPHGRPSDRTVEGMLRERRGTCSTKHLFLAGVLAERFPTLHRRSFIACTRSIAIAHRICSALK
jgi:hypothetical protein